MNILGGISLIYLDYAATTPMRKESIDAYVQANELYFGNSSSLHDYGLKANDVLMHCRREWALMIHGEEDGIYFTSGGTESNQLTVMSLLKPYKHKGKHIITTEAEHASLYHLFKQLSEDAFDVTFLPLTDDGLIDIEDVRRAIRPNTVLAAIHHGNSEVGFLQPIDQLGKLFHEHNVLFHVDCVQTFGHVTIDVERFKIDSLAISSHKIYGPKGVGLAYINPRVTWQSIVKHTTHENGFRPGTVNVPGIVAFTVAGQLIDTERDYLHSHFTSLRRTLKRLIKTELKDVRLLEHKIQQLPHIIGLIFSNLE